MTKYKKVPNILSQSCDGEAVLYDTERESYFSLNEVGGSIWAFLDEPIDVDSVVERVVSEFEVQAPEAKQDVEELFLSLEKAKLIEQVPE